MSFLDLHGEVRKLRWKIGRMFQERDVTCQTKNGLLTFSSKDNRIARRLYSRRQWSWKELLRFHNLLIDKGLLSRDENGVLVNVGANIGSMLIPMMDRGRFQQGLGFEPSPKNFRYLHTNVEQNNLSGRVRLFPVGLSDEDRDAELELSPENFGDHRVREVPSCQSRRERYDEHSRKVIPVKLRSLDAVMKEEGLELGKNSLIWVDIQGHEGHFFEGATKTLSLGTPVITEFWPYGIERSGFTGDRFCDLVSRLFREFYCWQNRNWQKQPISEIRELYRRYESGRSSVDVVLI